MLFAIEAIQERTRAALGAWCNVHWFRRAPFDHAYSEGQELTLMSESPILQLNCTQGLFQGVLLDADKVPELKVDEAGAILTMMASFLNLSDAEPKLHRAGQETRRAGRIMQAAVRDMGLLSLIRERFEEKFEAQVRREGMREVTA